MISKRTKKLILVSIIIAVFMGGSIMISDSMIPTYTGEGIINQDTNAFTIVEIDESDHSVSIYGQHSFLSLPKLAQGQYSNDSFLVADENEHPWITANVNLICTLKAALLSTATIIVSFLLSDSEYDELDITKVYECVVTGNTSTVNEELVMTGHFEYSLQQGEQYQISVRVTIILSGVSSVEGLLPDDPCSLIVNSIGIN